MKTYNLKIRIGLTLIELKVRNKISQGKQYLFSNLTKPNDPIQLLKIDNQD